MHPLCPSPSVRRFPIEGGLLLLDRAANCLYAYNDTARQVWDLIDAGRPEPDLIAEFADHWGIPQNVARADTEGMIALWQSQNVLVERGAPHGPAHTESPPRRPVNWSLPPDSGWWAEWICTIRGIPISFAIETKLPGTFRVLFAHLETPAAVPQARLEIRIGPIGEWLLIEDGRQRARTVDPAEAVGALLDRKSVVE